jgi:hypothetical protein
MENLPLYSDDLVDELDRMYPERCADPNKSDREIWQYVGARSLVRMLLAKKEQTVEQKNVINVFEKE